MSLFNTFLEIKTGKTDLPLKAVYMPDIKVVDSGDYHIYYYDGIKHTFYINKLRAPDDDRSKLEQLVNKIYEVEMSNCIDLLKRLHSQQVPKVFCISLQSTSNMLVIDKVKLKAKRGSQGNIKGFKLAN